MTDSAIAPVRPMGRRLLLVEDDGDMRTLTTEVLRGLGYGVAACETAESALKLLQRVPTPDALIVDLRMPEMSGWEFIEAVRSDTRHGHVPIVVLSALVTPEIARKLGANAYVRKPFQAIDLATTVEKACASP